MNFYPRPPRGGRLQRMSRTRTDIKFLSTPSARRATVVVQRLGLPIHNFYPRPPRGGRHNNFAQRIPVLEISIHALREEGDDVVVVLVLVDLVISIHALREEGDRPSKGVHCGHYDFYPRPPRGGRHLSAWLPERTAGISIHALREEGDRFPGLVGHLHVLFLSTPSARRATDGRPGVHQVRYISIHALREEGDSLLWAERSISMYFYPRPPRGGRPRT